MLQLQNPDALKLDEVRDLFFRAFASEKFSDAEEVMAYLAENLDDEKLAVFIAREGTGKLTGLSIVSDHRGIFAEQPWVLHIYSESNRSVALRLAERTRDWVKSRGGTAFRAMNSTGRSDEANILFFSPVTDGRVVGSIIEYTFDSEV